MLEPEEFQILIERCLEHFRNNRQPDVAERLEFVVRQPIVEEQGPGKKEGRDIAELTERERSSKEQFQAMIEFLEAHLVHIPNALGSISKIVDHDLESIMWAGNEEDGTKGFGGSQFALSQRQISQVKSHLSALKKAADMIQESSN